MSRWIVFALALLVAGCGSKPHFNSVDITGADYAHDFALTDQTGTPRTMADYRGKVVVLFFGYTHCPDLCPTTLASFAQVMTLLGNEAKRVQVLFVTLDPQRDTPKVLAQYLPAFYPSFVGLFADPQTIAKTAKAFRVWYKRVPGKVPGDYDFDHSGGSYVFDPQGRLRLYLRPGEKPADIAADIRILMRS